MQKRAAIYAGSFDPFTNGHHEIVLRGLELFDELVILVAVSNTKKALFSMEERVTMIKELYQSEARIKVDSSQGLLVDYARDHQIGFILRGLRPTGDFDYEFHMASMNYELNPQVETTFFITRKDHSCVSSTAIREIIACGGDCTKFVPSVIFSYLESNLQKNLQKRGQLCT